MGNYGSCMSNQNKAKRLAELVNDALADTNRSIVWLSTETGIANSTLHRNLTKTPEQFKLNQWDAIAAALGLEFEAAFTGVAA